MSDKHLLLSKDHGRFRGVVLDNEAAEQILSRDTIRLFGQNYAEKDAFCEWFEVVSKEDACFAGVCFTDFYNAATDSVMRGLDAENAKRTDDGLLLLLREVQNWEVQPGPYLPAYFLRAENGDFCYLVPSAFGPTAQPPSGFKHVSSLDEIAEAVSRQTV